MNQDSFEDKLSRQPMKSVPGDWRKEILSQAGKASHAHASLAKVVRVNPAGLAEIIGTKLKEWLWPHPVAWGGLASLWLIILGLNMITPQPRSFYAQNRLHATDQPRASVTAVEHNTLRKEMLEMSMIHLSRESKPQQSTPPGDRPRTHLLSTQRMV
jgi:hypothetical protein